MSKTNRLQLDLGQRAELEGRTRNRTGRADDARRARVLLMLADGETYSDIETAVGCSSAYIARWRSRFESEGIAGLYGRHRGAARTRNSPKVEARILEVTRRKPTDGTTHWSTRRLAKELKIPHMAVQRAWVRAGVKPHRMERYMASNDPNFEAKAADIIGLYLKPPQHAAVFCLDEKSHVQALDRLDPVLPFSPGRLERHGFEYFRHGTLSLFAAFNTKTGEVIGQTVQRHTSEEFVAFLSSVVASQPRGKEIHVILDNLSTHKTKRVVDFLASYPSVRLHYTPTYSSWLNQVENWFSKIERDVISRGVFTSIKDLARKLMRYIRKYNRDPRPIKWAYSDPSRRIRPDAVEMAGTGH